MTADPKPNPRFPLPKTPPRSPSVAKVLRDRGYEAEADYVDTLEAAVYDNGALAHAHEILTGEELRSPGFWGRFAARVHNRSRRMRTALEAIDAYLRNVRDGRVETLELPTLDLDFAPTTLDDALLATRISKIAAAGLADTDAPTFLRLEGACPCGRSTATLTTPRRDTCLVFSARCPFCGEHYPLEATS